MWSSARQLAAPHKRSITATAKRKGWLIGRSYGGKRAREGDLGGSFCCNSNPSSFQRVLLDRRIRQCFIPLARWARIQRTNSSLTLPKPSEHERPTRDCR